jgi:hypothetical protein
VPGKPALVSQLLVFTASLVLFSAIVSACASPPPGTGDPGNVRLHTLAAQPILKALPHASKVLRIESSPAQWDSVFGGWSTGPIVIEDFEVPHTANAAEASAEVASFFTATASKYGWYSDNAGLPPLGAGLLGTMSWSKLLRGGFMATMLLDQGPMNNVDVSRPYKKNPYVFTLSLGANPITAPGGSITTPR